MRRSVLVLAVAAALAFMVAGCSSTPSIAAEPSASAPQTSLEPSAPIAEPTPTPTPPPASEAPIDSVPIPSNAYARVVTDDLRVRSKPGVGEGSKKLEPLLQRGVLLVVLDGPVQAAGYDWYRVQPTFEYSDAEAITYPAGWVAAADKDGEPWIQSEQIACPDKPTDVQGLAAIHDTDEKYWELTCFSGEEISLTARLGALGEWCGLEDEWTWEPAWFGACETEPFALVPVDADDEEIMFLPAIPPEIETGIAASPDQPVDAWPIVEVTGFFDHPLAQSCHSVPNDNPSGEGGMGGEEPDPAQTILGCRRQFVVTSLRQL
jgi:hypothetical protein